MLVVYCWDTLGIAHEALVPYSALDTNEWEARGMLDVVVTGLRVKDGACAVVGGPRADSTRPGMGATTNAALNTLTPAEAICMARRNPHPTFSHKWVCLGWDGRWNGIYGWMLIHAFAGDGAVLRFHVYSRVLTEHPSAATVVRQQQVLDRPDRELSCMYLVW